ncbi:hypothetical protein ADUPG1_006804 [Aduncisulcus paluster]|uniref:Uncharacterized protein n=1 Tax=Aduncisulcus paluster TaxID=2918883 RepID=A0ABQ5KJN8_9EUKA|nr:hypothetical protein ADUPG1_006804 [Aduncisulcus paluster]
MQVVITKSGVMDLIDVGMEPAIDEFMYELEIPPITLDFSLGIGKGKITLDNFDIESFTFFDDDETVISFINNKGVSAILQGAGFVVSADYEIKLTTYPYTDYSGGVRITLQGISADGALSMDVKTDTSDLSCCPTDLTDPDGDDTCQSCGYIDYPQLDSLKLEMPYFEIEFLGDVNPILEAMVNFLSSTLIPWFVEYFSQISVYYINKDLENGTGSAHFHFTNSDMYFVEDGCPGIIISDNYISMPYYVGFSKLVDNSYKDPNTHLDPFMAEGDLSWYPTFPEVLTNTDFTCFLAPILLHSSWYLQLVENRSHWYKNGSFTGTKNKLECVSGRDGCTSSTMGLSDLSSIFESSTYASLGLTEISDCDGCDLEIDWGFADPDLDPVFPEAPTVNVDGLTMIYPDLIVRVRGVDPDSGDNIFTKEFVTTLEFKGLYISDHVYINFIQGFEAVTSIAYNSSISDSDSDLDSWGEIIALTTAVYLQPFFSNYFSFNWAWYHIVPLQYMTSCLMKEEEFYYSEDGWIALSANVDTCLCNRYYWIDDSARGDNGMFTCIPSGI